MALVGACAACAASACTPSSVYYVDNVTFDAFPARNVTLPLNGRIAFVRRHGESTVTPEDLAFTYEGDPLSADVVGRGLAPRQEAFVVTPTLEASPEATITVDARDGLPRQYTWTVSDVADDTPPSLDDGPIEMVDSAAYGLGDETGIEVAIQAQPSVDGEPYALRVAGDVDAFLLPSADVDAHYVLRVPGAQARQLCVDAFAVDVAGNETPLVSPLCADIEP